MPVGGHQFDDQLVVPTDNAHLALMAKARKLIPTACRVEAVTVQCQPIQCYLADVELPKSGEALAVGKQIRRSAEDSPRQRTTACQSNSNMMLTT